MSKSKKGISAVVAISLLLILTVVAVSAFNSWFNNYQSQTLVNVESQDSNMNSIKFEGGNSQDIYLYSKSEKLLNTFEISDDSGVVICSMKDNEQQDFKSNTLLLLNFDDGTASDLSGYNNSGDLLGTISYEDSCVSGGCLNFDGVDDYINLSNDFFSNEVIGDFTISTWYKSDDDTVINDEYIFIYTDSDDSKDTTIFGPTDDWTFDGYLRFHLRKSYAETYTLKSKTDVVDNQWHHLVGVREGDIIKIYVDGVFENSTIAFSDSLDFSQIATTHVYIGNLPNDDEQVYGSIDEFAFYTKALTDSEVKMLYDVKKAKFYEQFVSDGVNSLNISDCSLISGKKYNMLAFTNDKKVESEFIAR